VKSGCQVTPLLWDISPVDSMTSGPRKRAVERCEKSSSRRIIDPNLEILKLGGCSSVLCLAEVMAGR
jgi:hypothetical protein